MVTVFDESSSIGLVRFFFEKLVGQVKEMPAMDASRSTVKADSFEAELETSLDRFFRDLMGS